MTMNLRGAIAGWLLPGVAMGCVLGVVLAIGDGREAAVEAATAVGPASPAWGPVFAELDVAKLAARDPETGGWEVRGSAALPDAVAAWIEARLGPVVDARAMENEQLTLRGSLWRAILPDQLELYVFEELMPVARVPQPRILLRDAASDRLSKQPIELPKWWTGMGVPKMPPRLHLVQLDEHAPWQVALRTYAHNGTVYNAEQVRFFEAFRAGAELEIREVLTLDTVTQWPFGEWDAHAPGGVFASALVRDGSALRLEQWYEHAGAGVGRRPTARGRYVRSRAGARFELVDLQILDAQSPIPR